ncbi:MAG: hypothetical protein OEW40_18295 [Cyclobacteriaceae bacterium]|nr:hypothetical protein [Cyclobacteriaceae bacterium]
MRRSHAREKEWSVCAESPHMGRITKIYQNINSAPTDQFVSQYEYNELGQLVDKKLHNTTGTTFLQSVDYRYNIRGWISSINNSQLNVNSANNDEADDYFGMEFLYTTVESGLSNTTAFNGNISATKWKGFGTASGTTDQKSYKYTYDRSDRLLTSTSQMYTGSAWTKEASAQNETMTYDHNGNVKTLLRNHRKHQLAGTVASYVTEAVDNLTYTYGSTQGNQLAKVEDAVPLATGIGDFKNNASLTTEYTYNTDGNLTADKNKGIDSVHYNIQGKVRRVKFTDGRAITYIYDAGGNKLKMRTYQGTTLQTTTDYVGGFVYENATLSFFGSPEGRVVKNGSTFEYQYAIADHQGNTRVVFTSATPAPVAPVATFEGDGNDGASQYQNIVVANVVSFPSANHTAGGTKVLKMNQTTKIGATKSLKVYPGDKVDIEVWEYHEGASGFGTTTTPLTTLISMVAGAFGGVSGAPGDPGLIYSGVNSAVNGFLPAGNQGSTRPATYLNYILFDKNYKVLDMGWQLAPATTFTKQKLSFSTLNIKEAGFVFVYLSYDNDSNNWVYFDDFKVSQTMSNVLQYNEYYPFGMQASTSWTRDNTTNNFLYNAGNELNQTSGWYETFFRGYDPTLGRFNQVDPMAYASSSHTPYNFAFNDPVFYNDPNGDYPQEVAIDMERSGGSGAAIDPFGSENFENFFGGGYSSYHPPHANPDRAGPSAGEHFALSFVKKWLGQEFEAGYTYTEVHDEGYHTGTEYGELGSGFTNKNVGFSFSYFRRGNASDCCGGLSEYDIPVWGKAKAAGDAFNNGRYLDAAAWEVLGFADMLGVNALYKAVATQAAKLFTQAAVKATQYTFTNTAAGHLATRPYMNSPLLIQEIMSSGPGVADASFTGGMNWRVPGIQAIGLNTSEGTISQGVYELGINPQTGKIYHFVFKSVK